MQSQAFAMIVKNPLSSLCQLSIPVPIEENFLLDEGGLKKSKRNKFYNPWVTNGIISSIQRKCLLYRQWKRTCSKKDVVGDKIKYERYMLYRLQL